MALTLECWKNKRLKSELVFSPSIQTTTKSTSFFGNNSIDSKSTLNLQNWGMVFSSKLGKDDDLPEWKYINFGFGMNKYSILSSRTYIAGTNELSSIGFLFGFFEFFIFICK
jgi:hypothetical protein